MRRQPTVSIYKNSSISLSQCIPDTLGDVLNFGIDHESKQILINKDRGEHLALVNYPAAMPIVKSAPLIKWIRKELGDMDFSKMPVEWDGEQYRVKPGVMG